MRLMGKDSKKLPTEDARDVKVKVNLLTGSKSVDARELLSSKATRDLLRKAKCIEERIIAGRDVGS